MSEEDREDYKTGDMYVGPSAWMRHDKFCSLQSPHDLLLHAICSISYDMDKGFIIAQMDL